MAYALKQMLVGTSAGRAVMAVRDTFRLLQAPRVEFGTIVNDQIATSLVVALCPAKGTFVDIGAHIGSVVSDVSFRRPNVSIVAFEAVPDKAEALRRKFPAVEVHNFALWDSEGEASFFVDLKHSSCSSLAHRHSLMHEIHVLTRKLDSILSGRAIDMIKLDVEGAELGVLRGGSEVIAASRPVIMFESGPTVCFDFTKEKMYEFFSERDYSLYAPNRLAHTGAPMTLDAFLDSHEYPRRTTNYFALPAERELAIRELARSLSL